MRHRWGTGLMVPALLLVFTGCATKDFVREHVGKRETEIDQRIAAVDSRLGSETKRIDGNVSEQAQRVEGMGFRVQGVEKQVGEVGETAKAARGRADEAFTKAEDVDGRVTRLWTKRHDRTLVDSVNVQFAFAKAELTDAAQTALLSVIKELKENPNLTVDLQGYTDSTGPKDYNVELSQRRVEAVRRYLIEQGAEMPRINSVGLGPIMDKGDKAKNRRVTVKLMVATE